MNNILDDFNEEDSSIHTGNVFSKILTSPKATLSFILNRKPPDLYVPQLLIAGAFINALDAEGLFFRELLFIITTLIYTTAIGVAVYHIYAWAIKSTGKWLGGNTTTRKCRTVLAWSVVPSFGGIILIGILYFIQTSDLYYTKPDTFYILALGISIIQIILSIWGLVICTIGISLAQGFGYFKAFINLLIPLVFAVIIGFVCFLLLSNILS